MEPGAKLPTEPELARLHGVGRHSVRRAVADLARVGHLRVEQGRGTFVQSRPMIDYAIGRRTRLRQNLSGQSTGIAGDLTRSERLPARGRAAQALGLGLDDELLLTRHITRADGVPLSIGALYHDNAKFSDFPELYKQLGSVSAVYRRHGITDYLRAQTSIHARPARGDEAAQLEQHPELPVLVVRAVDALLDGTPVAFSEVVWSAGRVKFSVMTQEEDDET